MHLEDNATEDKNLNDGIQEVTKITENLQCLIKNCNMKVKKDLNLKVKGEEKEDLEGKINKDKK